jgi:hypothetical protein
MEVSPYGNKLRCFLWIVNKRVGTRNRKELRGCRGAKSAGQSSRQKKLPAQLLYLVKERNLGGIQLPAGFLEGEEGRLVDFRKLLLPA